MLTAETSKAAPRGCSRPVLPVLEPVFIAGDSAGARDFFVRGREIFAVNLAVGKKIYRPMAEKSPPIRCPSTVNTGSQGEQGQSMGKAPLIGALSCIANTFLSQYLPRQKKIFSLINRAGRIWAYPSKRWGPGAQSRRITPLPSNLGVVAESRFTASTRPQMATTTVAMPQVTRPPASAMTSWMVPLVLKPR